MSRILLSGGSGRLGTELRALLPDVAAPDENEMDITDPGSIRAAMDRYDPAIFVHAAAYPDVSGAETNRKACLKVNVEGTRNVARACTERDVLLVHISTDYVFEGKTGNYREDDPLGPPMNYYALSKLVAEELARFVPRHLVIRTSFRPREWPYPTAFTDVYTSQDYVDRIAPDIALAIENVESIPYDTLHIAGVRTSVFELARRRKPDVRPGSKHDVRLNLPDDVSMDTSRWQTLKSKLIGLTAPKR